jgi:hypothetical protein
MARPLALATLLLVSSLRTAVAAPSTADDYAEVRRFCEKDAIALYSYHEKYIGNSQGYLAPLIKTSDGGFLVVGTKSDNKPGPTYKYRMGRSRPVVVKLDKALRRVWERAYKKAGFLDYEAASAIEIDDGYLVHILSYVHPAKGSVTRLLKLSRRGEVVWDRRLRGKGDNNTPFPQTVQLTKSGTLVMKGHIYLDHDRKAYGWKGEVDGMGRVTLDEVGEPNPYKSDKGR